MARNLDTDKGTPFDPHWLRNLRQGELVVGYRFDTDLVKYDDAMCPVIMQDMPVAGPIFFAINQEPWARYNMKCAGCDTTSKFYKIRHQGLLTWARRHRCHARVELNHALYHRTGMMSTISHRWFYTNTLL